ncbi:uncharacterized protein N7459_003709, partial [Penicillium hispanicum]|uniref:uncharacterized protein n=1 Tax=Penicillium hispanicum TaxID=1080232 RepID=UPI00253FC0E2
MSRTRQPGANPQLQTTTETSRDSSTVRLSGTLRLRGEDSTTTTGEPSAARRIRWSEDVVDNEGMGKKSSKAWVVCCIYHKSRPVGESSSESSSSSSDSNSSDSESDNEVDRRRLGRNNSHHPHNRGRQPRDGNSQEQSPDQTTSGCCSQHRQARHRKPSPNAYEKMPKSSKNIS